MSSKDDVTTPKPHIINALTEINGQTIYLNFDITMNAPDGNEDYLSINSSTFSSPITPFSITNSNDNKSFIVAIAGNVITNSIDLTVLKVVVRDNAVNGQTLDTVDEYYVQNNTDL